MKPVVATFPGKIGDALLQWPVIRLAKKRFECWLDEKSLKPLVQLFESQPCVSKVKLIPGIKHYTTGGQPFDFGLTTKDHMDYEIYHMGMRGFPQRQITLQTLEWLPFDLDQESLANEPSLIVNSTPSNRCVLHGTFKTHMISSPAFWRVLNRVKEDLEERFEEIYFVGTDSEVDRALELYPKWKGFKDGGNLLETARLVGGAEFVMGSGSSVVTLGGALKIPTLRVHDDIGGAAKVIWSNLGPNQWNETERDLREKWPEILAGVTVCQNTN